MAKIRKIDLFYFVFLLAIFFVGLILRILIFDKTGGDYNTYKDAMNMFHQGQNPYIYTVESFKSDALEHGYAYFPTLLYIQYFIWLLNNFSGIIISTVILWKIPVLIADFSIIFIILKKFGKPKNFGQLSFFVISAFFWVVNPYLISRYDYSLYDPLFMIFLLLAVEKMETNSFLSGIFYALSVSLKTIPVILFPLFLLKTPKALKFFLAGALIFLIISLPFLRTVSDFQNYLQGAFFVHSERELQGRPFISFLGFNLREFGINFMQHTQVSLFSLASMIFAFFVPLFIFLKKKLQNKYSWIFLSFLIYLIFTPVLSRTHILWIFPWVILFAYEKLKLSQKYLLAGVSIMLFWLVSFFYLLNWNNGFSVAIEDRKQRLILENSDEEWELKRILRQKYYEFRSNLSG